MLPASASDARCSGRTWSYLQPPPKRADGSDWTCKISDTKVREARFVLCIHDPDRCTALLLPVLLAASSFRFDAPQLRQGLLLDRSRLCHGRRLGRQEVGVRLEELALVLALTTIRTSLLPYEDCETFLSTDAGVSWRMVLPEAHKYEFGDQGSIIVAAPDEAPTSVIRYSLDAGKTWSVITTCFLRDFAERSLSTRPQEGLQARHHAQGPPAHHHSGLDLAEVHPPRLPLAKGCRQPGTTCRRLPRLRGHAHQAVPQFGHGEVERETGWQGVSHGPQGATARPTGDSHL